MARVSSCSSTSSCSQQMWKANYIMLLATLMPLVMAVMASAASAAPEQGGELGAAPGTGRFLLQAGSFGGGRRLLNGDHHSCGDCKKKHHGYKNPQCCNHKCIDVGGDSDLHCGACDNKCRFGLDCCAGKCVDEDTDRNNCGKCGRRCPNNQPCRKGTCGYNGKDH